MDKLLELEKKLIQVREELGKSIDERLDDILAKAKVEDRRAIEREGVDSATSAAGATEEGQRSDPATIKAKAEKDAAAAMERSKDHKNVKPHVDERNKVTVPHNGEVKEVVHAEPKRWEAKPKEGTTKVVEEEVRSKGHNAKGETIVHKPLKVIGQGIKIKKDSNGNVINEVNQAKADFERWNAKNEAKIAARPKKEEPAKPKTTIIRKKPEETKKSIDERLDDLIKAVTPGLGVIKEKKSEVSDEQKMLEEKLKDPEARKMMLNSNIKATNHIRAYDKQKKADAANQNKVYDKAVAADDPDQRPPVSQKKRSQTGIDQVNRRKEAPDKKLIAKENKGFL
jgi:hypothetical protein